MPRPNWIVPGLEPSGKKQWALPPDAHGTSKQCVGLRDWFEREDIWKHRAISKIPGCGVDTTHLMRVSFRENLGCLPMQKDCNDCEHYTPNKCMFVYKKMGEACPLDAKKGSHTMEDCAKCQHYLPSGYICQKWAQKDQDWKELWGKEAGKTAIICAPGPHLLDHKEEIEKYYADRENYFVMGISRAIFGVPLHYYFSMERRKPAHWNPEEQKFPQTTLIASTAADWRMCRAFRNRYWGETFNTVDEVGNFLDSGKERLTIALGNCSADAMMIAVKLGAKRIILYGYEFACEIEHTPDNRHEVSKYYFDMDIRKQHFNFYSVSRDKYFPAWGADGKLCGISYSLLAVSFYCEAAANLIASKGIPVTNGGGEGAFWLGVEDAEKAKHEAQILALKEQNRQLNDRINSGETEVI